MYRATVHQRNIVFESAQSSAAGKLEQSCDTLQADKAVQESTAEQESPEPDREAAAMQSPQPEAAAGAPKQKKKGRLQRLGKKIKEKLTPAKSPRQRPSGAGFETFSDDQKSLSGYSDSPSTDATPASTPRGLQAFSKGEAGLAGTSLPSTPKGAAGSAQMLKDLSTQAVPANSSREPGESVKPTNSQPVTVQPVPAMEPQAAEYPQPAAGTASRASTSEGEESRATAQGATSPPADPAQQGYVRFEEAQRAEENDTSDELPLRNTAAQPLSAPEPAVAQQLPILARPSPILGMLRIPAVDTSSAPWPSSPSPRARSSHSPSPPGTPRASSPPVSPLGTSPRASANAASAAMHRPVRLPPLPAASSGAAFSPQPGPTKVEPAAPAAAAASGASRASFDTWVGSSSKASPPAATPAGAFESSDLPLPEKACERNSLSSQASQQGSTQASLLGSRSLGAAASEMRPASRPRDAPPATAAAVREVFGRDSPSFAGWTGSPHEPRGSTQRGDASSETAEAGSSADDMDSVAAQRGSSVQGSVSSASAFAFPQSGASSLGARPRMSATSVASSTPTGGAGPRGQTSAMQEVEVSGPEDSMGGSDANDSAAAADTPLRPPQSALGSLDESIDSRESESAAEPVAAAVNSSYPAAAIVGTLPTAPAASHDSDASSREALDLTKGAARSPAELSTATSPARLESPSLQAGTESRFAGTPSSPSVQRPSFDAPPERYSDGRMAELSAAQEMRDAFPEGETIRLEDDALPMRQRVDSGQLPPTPPPSRAASTSTGESVPMPAFNFSSLFPMRPVPEGRTLPSAAAVAGEQTRGAPKSPKSTGSQAGENAAEGLSKASNRLVETHPDQLRSLEATHVPDATTPHEATTATGSNQERVPSTAGAERSASEAAAAVAASPEKKLHDEHVYEPEEGWKEGRPASTSEHGTVAQEVKREGEEAPAGESGSLVGRMTEVVSEYGQVAVGKAAEAAQGLKQMVGQAMSTAAETADKDVKAVVGEKPEATAPWEAPSPVLEAEQPREMSSSASEQSFAAGGGVLEGELPRGGRTSSTESLAGTDTPAVLETSTPREAPASESGSEVTGATRFSESPAVPRGGAVLEGKAPALGASSSASSLAESSARGEQDVGPDSALVGDSGYESDSETEPAPGTRRLAAKPPLGDTKTGGLVGAQLEQDEAAPKGTSSTEGVGLVADRGGLLGHGVHTGQGLGAPERSPEVGEKLAGMPAASPATAAAAPASSESAPREAGQLRVSFHLEEGEGQPHGAGVMASRHASGSLGLIPSMSAELFGTHAPETATPLATSGRQREIREPKQALEQLAGAATGSTAEQQADQEPGDKEPKEALEKLVGLGTPMVGEPPIREPKQALEPLLHVSNVPDGEGSSAEKEPKEALERLVPLAAPLAPTEPAPGEAREPKQALEQLVGLGTLPVEGPAIKEPKEALEKLTQVPANIPAIELALAPQSKVDAASDAENAEAPESSSREPVTGSVPEIESREKLETAEEVLDQARPTATGQQLPVSHSVSSAGSSGSEQSGVVEEEDEVVEVRPRGILGKALSTVGMLMGAATAATNFALGRGPPLSPRASGDHSSATARAADSPFGTEEEEDTAAEKAGGERVNLTPADAPAEEARSKAEQGVGPVAAVVGEIRGGGGGGSSGGSGGVEKGLEEKEGADAGMVSGYGQAAAEKASALKEGISERLGRAVEVAQDVGEAISEKAGELLPQPANEEVTYGDLPKELPAKDTSGSSSNKGGNAQAAAGLGPSTSSYRGPGGDPPAPEVAEYDTAGLGATGGGGGGMSLVVDAAKSVGGAARSAAEPRIARQDSAAKHFEPAMSESEAQAQGLPPATAEDSRGAGTKNVR